MKTLISIGRASHETKLEEQRHRANSAQSQITGWIVVQEAPQAFFCRAVYDLGFDPLIAGTFVPGSATPPDFCTEVKFD